MTLGQKPGPKIFSKSLIMLFSPWVNLGLCKRDYNQHTCLLPIPAHWKVWRRHWLAWSHPSASPPIAPQSLGQPPPHLQSLWEKWLPLFALDLLYVAWCVNYGHRFSFITVPSDLSIRLLLDLKGNFASFLTFPPQHRSFWSHPEFPPRQQSIGCHQSSPHP